MAVQVIKLVLQPELGHNLMYRAWTERGLVYVLYICELWIIMP
jgi:hypothetical protein